MSANPEREIVELHVFLEEWLSGRAERSDRAFTRFADALHPAFRIISPGGMVTARAPLVEGLRDSHGAAGPSFGIEIRAVRTVQTEATFQVLTYEEWQWGRGEPTARISTAVFHRDAGGPNGVRWLHLHETWLPAGQVNQSVT